MAAVGVVEADARERGAKERRVCRFLAGAGLRGAFVAVRRRAGAIFRLARRVVCLLDPSAKYVMERGDVPRFHVMLAWRNVVQASLWTYTVM